MQLKFLPWKYIQSSLPRPNTYLFVHSHITYHNQGICIKNRVRNGRKIFEIPALLSIPNPNEELQSGKFKKVYIVSTMNFDFFFFPIFSALDFLISKIKEREFQISFSVVLYHIFYITLTTITKSHCCHTIDLLEADTSEILS